MLTKVMPNINKSVWRFLCKPCFVHRPLYIFGYIQFIEKSIACTRFCQPDVYSAKRLTFTFQQHGYKELEYFKHRIRNTSIILNIQVLDG